MKRIASITIAAALAAQIGCGTSKTSDVAGNPTQTTPAATSNAAPPTYPTTTASNGPAAASSQVRNDDGAKYANKKPEQIVEAFLDSMRAGNPKQIEVLMSAAARAEIENQGLEVSPIGSPLATFQIDGSQVEADGLTAMVSSFWKEPAANGEPAHEYEVVWGLRKETQGWRICSMAVDTHIEGEDVQIVNFENLSDPNLSAEPPAARTAALPNGPANAPANNAGAPAGLPSNAPFPQSGVQGNALPGSALPPAGLPTNSGFVPNNGQPAPAGQFNPGALPPAGLPPTGLPPQGPANFGGATGSQQQPTLPPNTVGGVPTDNILRR